MKVFSWVIFVIGGLLALSGICLIIRGMVIDVAQLIFSGDSALYGMLGIIGLLLMYLSQPIKKDNDNY